MTGPPGIRLGSAFRRAPDHRTPARPTPRRDRPHRPDRCRTMGIDEYRHHVVSPSPAPFYISVGCREHEPGPGRAFWMERASGGGNRQAAAARLLQPVEPEKRKQPVTCTRAGPADDFSRSRYFAALGRQRALDPAGKNAAARSSAVLDARYDLLADKTAFAKADGPDLVEIRLMREDVTALEVLASFRQAERDPLPMISAGSVFGCPGPVI